MTVRGPPVSKQNQVSAQCSALCGFRAQFLRPFFVGFFAYVFTDLVLDPTSGASGDVVFRLTYLLT